MRQIPRPHARQPAGAPIPTAASRIITTDAYVTEDTSNSAWSRPGLDLRSNQVGGPAPYVPAPVHRPPTYPVAARFPSTPARVQIPTPAAPQAYPRGPQPRPVLTPGGPSGPVPRPGGTVPRAGGSIPTPGAGESKALALAPPHARPHHPRQVSADSVALLAGDRGRAAAWLGDASAPHVAPEDAVDHANRVFRAVKHAVRNARLGRAGEDQIDRMYGLMEQSLRAKTDVAAVAERARADTVAWLLRDDAAFPNAFLLAEQPAAPTAPAPASSGVAAPSAASGSVAVTVATVESPGSRAMMATQWLADLVIGSYFQRRVPWVQYMGVMAAPASGGSPHKGSWRGVSFVTRRPLAGLASAGQPASAGQLVWYTGTVPNQSIVVESKSEAMTLAWLAIIARYAIVNGFEGSRSDRVRYLNEFVGRGLSAATRAAAGGPTPLTAMDLLGSTMWEAAIVGGHSSVDGASAFWLRVSKMSARVFQRDRDGFPARLSPAVQTAFHVSETRAPALWLVVDYNEWCGLVVETLAAGDAVQASGQATTAGAVSGETKRAEGSTGGTPSETEEDSDEEKEGESQGDTVARLETNSAIRQLEAAHFRFGDSTAAPATPATPAVPDWFGLYLRRQGKKLVDRYVGVAADFKDANRLYAHVASFQPFTKRPPSEDAAVWYTGTPDWRRG